MLHKAFEVKVLNSIRETPNGYVYMKHGTQYSIEMSNHRDLRCNAEIKLDGKSVGVWRIPAYGTIVIERPIDDDGIFTFYKKGSKESKMVDVGITEGKHGLIEIEFIPEYKSYWRPAIYVNPWGYYLWGHYPRGPIYGSSGWGSSNSINYCASNSVLRSAGMQHTNNAEEANAGMTGLSGESKQKFSDAEYMTLDYGNKVTINLRLVAQRRRSKNEKENSPRPVKETGPRPILMMKATPVPPPVG